MFDISHLTKVFQPTPPRGRRRPYQLTFALVENGFNPRLRAGGDPRAAARPPLIMSFNPRLRAGGDYGPPPEPAQDDVSTHASAREATLGHVIADDPWWVSTHASAREATTSLLS